MVVAKSGSTVEKIYIKLKYFLNFQENEKAGMRVFEFIPKIGNILKKLFIPTIW